MRIRIPMACATLAILPVSAPALTYDDCVVLVATDPVRAEREAIDWVRSEGGAPARHCQALALLAQGAEARAAALLVEIAATDRALPDTVRGDILVEAGEILLEIGALAEAERAAARGLHLSPGARGALTLAARVKAERGDWKGAIGDLDDALAAGQPDPEILVLRASAQRRTGARVAARSDLIWAEELAPELPSLWLERGALAEDDGEKDEARGAYLKAIDLDRDGAVGAAARLRLQRMDAQ